MKYLFITLFAIVLACIAPNCLAQPNGGWATGGSWGGNGISGGWSGGLSGGGSGGWGGVGGGSCGPQVVSATWGATVPGPALRLLPASSHLVHLGGGHSCGCGNIGCGGSH